MKDVPPNRRHLLADLVILTAAPAALLAGVSCFRQLCRLVDSLVPAGSHDWEAIAIHARTTATGFAMLSGSLLAILAARAFGRYLAQR